MSRQRLIAYAVGLALLVPGVARAHEGHVHKVLGVITSIQGPHVDVKKTDGKTVTVMLDEKTTITRGKEKVEASALKVGDRVSVDAMQEKNMMMAHSIKLGTAPAKSPAAKK